MSYQRVSNELAVAQITAHRQNRFFFEGLEKAFNELSYEMNLQAKVDAQVHGEYKKMMNGFLIKAMGKRVGL